MQHRQRCQWRERVDVQGAQLLHHPMLIRSEQAELRRGSAPRGCVTISVFALQSLHELFPFQQPQHVARPVDHGIRQSGQSPDFDAVTPIGAPGLQPMQEAGQPDPAAGRRVFAGICSRCHGPEGQGGGIAPPLWGSGSFTTGSDFTDQPTLASFVHKFMPYRKPTLSPQQASDAAAFVLTVPRQEPGAKAPPMAAPYSGGIPPVRTCVSWMKSKFRLAALMPHLEWVTSMPLTR